MLFKCPTCDTIMPPGVNACFRASCVQKEAERQTVMKCQELGIPYKEELFGRPHPTGDP